ncbi:MAG: LytTR family DNA-binding domain-containing protein [Gammaproteobacteria bacterium]|jgi:two-component system response regulator AlgR|nr:LytTR family DNA-binding domain-containing protein [Gammaproteobacteria bacterium]
MRVLITDDEAPARERLRRLLGELPGVEFVGEAASGGEALELNQRLRPDVVLMDIRMPGIDGLEAAQHLVASPQPPAVVFTTAYGDHALAAFDAHAIDYLLKPVRRERLAQALSRASALRQARLQSLREEAGSGARTHICVRHGGSLRLVPVADIVCFRADHKYVEMHHADGMALIDESLRALEAEFSATFVRIHRNTLVAKAAIVALHRTAEGGCRIELHGLSDRLEVSRRHAGEVRNLLASGA